VRQRDAGGEQRRERAACPAGVVEFLGEDERVDRVTAATTD
jgi:hypothetical protein